MKTKLAIGIAVVVVIVLIALLAIRRRPKRLNNTYFLEQWQELQKSCADRKTWYQAIIDADELVDKALKRRRYKGKTTGERLVAAQHQLTSNDTIWFGHKLRNQIVHENRKKLSKQDTLEALSGFRQALKDLGALADNKKSEVEND